ncbi:Cyclin-dependent kinase-like 1 [Coemansia brasiliensis]|uniref:Cyclin-dependent kinase-like 1 n=1 Tax=Coemansia brasiliensis TaxID=2650707 RepID=A0A9W8M1N5_9FUNG|nr:Cyclin-dependent kinase-like 1 [Coemansia brasiliensis]
MSIDFTHRNGKHNSVLVDVVTGKSNDGTMFEITKNACIYQSVHPRNKLCHVFEAEYQGEKAILKITWEFVDLLPEPAVYDALQAAGVPNIPVVLDSGIIVQNAFNYRAEYVVMEYAGVPLVDFMDAYKSSTNDWLYTLTNNVLVQVVGCLARAWEAGILHRDVSRGNVLVRAKGNVTLIDWGYAKLLSNGPANTNELATKWHYNKYNVAECEDRQDSYAGSPLFMSIPVLLQANYRTVVNDVESIFYVALDALSAIWEDEADDEVPVALSMKDQKTLAHVRRFCLFNKNTYKESFGVYCQHKQLDETLEQLYEYLFTSNGQYIGDVLAKDLKWERPVNINRLLKIAKIEPDLTWRDKTRAGRKRLLEESQ